MKNFSYKVRDRQGKLKEGVVRADSLEHAQQHFKDMGVMVIQVKEQRSRFGSLGKIAFFGGGVSANDIMIFTRQMYALCVAGLPLVSGLKSLESSSKKNTMQLLLADIRKDIESGSSFSSALLKHPKVFTKIYCSIVQAGEASGSLPEVLDRLADTLEKEQETRSKIKQALAYPVIIICFILGALLVVGMFVLPRFVALFNSFGVAELPLMTRILIGANTALRSYWYIVLVGIFAFGFLFRKFRTSQFGKPIWDRFVLNIIIFGPLILKYAMSSFTRTVSALVKSGVPIVETLSLGARTSSNIIVFQAIERVMEKVKEGKSIGASMSEESLFPDMVVQMVAAGEEAGRVDELMEIVAKFYDREVDLVIKNLTTLIEPFLISAIACIVLTLALGIFLPLWNLGQVVTA